MGNLGRNFDFDGVGNGKNGPKNRKRPRSQTHKLCYARLPGLLSTGNPSSVFVRRRHSPGSRSAIIYFAHVMFQRRASSSRLSCSARERWGLNENELRSPMVIRRIKSDTLRWAFMALRCSLLLALALSLWSIGPRFRNSKKSVVTTRIARRPT